VNRQKIFLGSVAWEESLMLSLALQQGQQILLDVFTKLDVPVGEVNKMLPTVMTVQAEVNLHKGTPLGPLGLANEMDPGFLRSVIGFLGIALDAGANNVFPRGGAAAVARDDVVEIQILALENDTAILAGVFVALKDVVARELHLFLGHAIIHEEQDDARDADAKGDGGNGFLVRGAFGEIAPFGKIESAERTVLGVDDNLGVALKKQSEGAPGGTDIYGLPKPV
jgi:hypothetical protein